MEESTNIPATADTALLVTSSNFESRKVQLVNNDTLRIKPTISSLAFSFMFVVLGLSLVGLWVAGSFTSFEGPGSIPMLLVGVLFSSAGLWMYHSSNEQVIINRDTGAAFIRSWRLSVALDPTLIFKHVQAKDITAVQTISRTVKHRSSRSRRYNHYIEHQVNLCISGNERLNVFVTLKPKKSDELGNQLATMFSVPLHAVNSNV